ncbi:MAG: hypothetical protein HY402_05410 [Elusimicrobia bacterium]|nr:hypothetical protein [Elusimicrobiota bacterium]
MTDTDKGKSQPDLAGHLAICPDYDDILIHPGRHLTAEWYYTIEDDMPAREYYEGLAEMDQDRNT